VEPGARHRGLQRSKGFWISEKLSDANQKFTSSRFSAELIIDQPHRARVVLPWCRD
jgi:hypothetical protein